MIPGGVLAGFLTVSPVFRRHIPNILAFLASYNVSLVVPDRLGQCSIRKKVFYAKNDHGNHLKDGHPPDYRIHLKNKLLLVGMRDKGWIGLNV
jgi:hypothetical protein